MDLVPCVGIEPTRANSFIQLLTRTDSTDSKSFQSTASSGGTERKRERRSGKDEKEKEKEKERDKEREKSKEDDDDDSDDMERGVEDEAMRRVLAERAEFTKKALSLLIVFFVMC